MAVRKVSVGRKDGEGNVSVMSTDVAMFLVRSLNRIGIRTELVSREVAGSALRERTADTEFSVADIQRLDYEWNGERISLKVFSQTFGGLIRQKDRTMDDVERIAREYIGAVKENPSAFIPQLKAENMSHWRYFMLRDGSMYSPLHILADSPAYEMQKGLYLIYESVLSDRLSGFMDMVSRYASLSAAERESFLEMEREVSGSDLMQRTLEVNAEKVNERRNRDVRNLIQYFDNNTDYTFAEKALILKGSMTYSYSEKKRDGGRNEVKLVRITDSNDVSLPVVGGDAASVVEGLRKGLDFRDSLILARNSADDSRTRSVASDFTGWKVYARSDREEDAVILQKDAAGTGWCTGGAVSTARTHLSGGDFHIYFMDGEPLIAIRTQDGRLAEAPRGAHEGQFCTPEEEDIAFRYIQEGHGIVGGRDYIADMLDLRTLRRDDCTWRDIIGIPVRRRYENGEYGGDTGSWGEAAEAKMRRIMSESRKERFAAGYYTPQEIAETGVSTDEVVGLLNYDFFEFSFGWPKLEFVKREVFVQEGVHVNLPRCQSVGGGVYVGNNATLDLPQCRSVGGDVYVRKNATLDFPQCESVGGCVDVYENGTLELSQCESVGGYVNVGENGTLGLPRCESVGEYVYVGDNGTLELLRCQSVGRHVYVGNNGTLGLPQCQSVGGYVDVGNNATLDLPQCKHADIKGNIKIDDNAKYVNIGGDVRSSFHLSDGTVYGYERDNTIYLTSEGVNANTPIHEYAHIWAKAIRKVRPDLWNRIKDMLMENVAWDFIASRREYDFLWNDEDRLCGEVLATVVGDGGERLLRDAANSAVQSGRTGVLDVVRELKAMIGTSLKEDVFCISDAGVLDVDAVTLDVMRSLVEQRDLGLSGDISVDVRSRVDVHQSLPKQTVERIRLT